MIKKFNLALAVAVSVSTTTAPSLTARASPTAAIPLVSKAGAAFRAGVQEAAKWVPTAISIIELFTRFAVTEANAGSKAANNSSLIFDDVERRLRSIESELNKIRSTLSDVSKNLELAPQISFYDDAYAVYQRVRYLANALEELSSIQRKQVFKSSTSVEFHLLMDKFASAASNARSIAQRAETISPEFVIGLHLISVSAEPLLGLARTHLNDADFAVVSKTSKGFLRDLRDVALELTGSDGLLTEEVWSARNEYQSKVERLSADRFAFRLFAQLPDELCIETRHVSPTTTYESPVQQLPANKYYPPKEYVIQNRETGEYSEPTYSHGYMHFRSTEVSVEPVYVNLDGYRMIAGIASAREQSSERHALPIAECDIRLESRNAAVWIETERKAFNKLLSELEPEALRLIMTIESHELVERTASLLQSIQDNPN